MSILFAGRRGPGPQGFRPLDPLLPEVARHRPLALAILADYGDPSAAVDRVSAIVDWVARTAIHGHSFLRLPTPYLAGTATLPAGATWATVQAVLTAARQDADNVFWGGFNHDAAAMLDVLLGTLQPNGSRAQDGTMKKVTAGGALAHYRYRSLATVRSVWCTWQHDIATLLLATIGYPSMLAHITGHDPLRVVYGEHGEWGYWCATYNEHYTLISGDRPLDLAELRDLTQADRLAEITRRSHPGPVWDPVPYISASYLADYPQGWPIWSVSLDSRIVPNGRIDRSDRLVDDPRWLSSIAPRVREAVASPYLGAYLAGLPVDGLDAATFQVASSWPGTTELHLRLAAGSWTLLSPGTASTLRVIAGSGPADVAPVDAAGRRGPAISVDR